MNEANKVSHIDIVQNPDVKSFLQNCTYMREPTMDEIEKIVNQFTSYNIDMSETLPDNIITIDSSSYESSIREDIPFTNIGYVKLVDSLLKNSELLKFKGEKFVDPFKVARVFDEKETITFVLPSSNIKYKNSENAKESFRLALEEYFENIRENKMDRTTSLKFTLFWLFSYGNGADKDKIVLHKCPNCDVPNITVLNIEEDQFCPHCGKQIFATDRLRFYEEVDDSSPSNKGVLGRFENAIRHIYLAHILRILILKNKNTYLQLLNNIAIIINGPLAISGTAALLHGKLMKIIHEVNVKLNEKGYKDLLVIGLLKGGRAINDYALLIEKHLDDDCLLCVSDEFREKYINYSREASGTTFGSETYYGQDFIWKASNRLLVFNLPYTFYSKENLSEFVKCKSDITKYNNLNKALKLLRELKCDMDMNSIGPLVISKTYTAISMEPGSKVLDMLSKNNFF